MNIAELSKLVACISVAALVTACSSTSSRSHYPTAHAGIAHKLEHGTILETRDVVIDGQATNVGTVVGGGIGGAVGAIAVPVKSTTSITQNDAGGLDIHGSSNVHESRAAMGIGAAVGVLAGRHIEKKLSARKAQELVIQLDSGERVVIIQPNREPPFISNERVQVYTTALGNSRVFHGDEDPYVDPETNAYLIEEEGEEFEDEPVVW